MKSPFRTDRILHSADETSRFAAALGARLAPGDVLLLSGGIGAGKTHFARALILSLLDAPEDVPSPTFTLVQEYETRAGPLWHADLYRLSDPLEAVELGLEEAFSDAICLVEWPDRLADLAPPGALSLDFETIRGAEDSRRVTITGPENWRPRVEEALA